MKKVVKISILTATVAVAIMFLGGCKKETGPSLVSGGFNGKITATVDTEDWDLSPLKFVVPWNDPRISGSSLLGEQMGDGVNFSNKKFTITLPNPPPSNVDLNNVKDAFEDMIDGTLKFSDPKVLVADVEFLAHTGEYFTGFFYNASSDKKTACYYVYADGDVNVTGGNNISISLKEGWNRVYHINDGKNNKFTTKAPDGELKWYYDNF